MDGLSEEVKSKRSKKQGGIGKILVDYIEYLKRKNKSNNYDRVAKMLYRAIGNDIVLNNLKLNELFLKSNVKALLDKRENTNTKESLLNRLKGFHCWLSIRKIINKDVVFPEITVDETPRISQLPQENIGFHPIKHVKGWEMQMACLFSMDLHMTMLQIINMRWEHIDMGKNIIVNPENNKKMRLKKRLRAFLEYYFANHDKAITGLIFEINNEKICEKTLGRWLESALDEQFKGKIKFQGLKHHSNVLQDINPPELWDKMPDNISVSGKLSGDDVFKLPKKKNESSEQNLVYKKEVEMI